MSYTAVSMPVVARPATRAYQLLTSQENIAPTQHKFRSMRRAQARERLNIKLRYYETVMGTLQQQLRDWESWYTWKYSWYMGDQGTSRQEAITIEEERTSQSEIDRMMQQEDTLQAEDASDKTMIEETNGLENHRVTMHHALNEEKLKKIEGGDKEKSKEDVQDSLPNFEDEAEAKQKEPDGVVCPSVMKMKMHQAAGGGGGMQEDGMPGSRFPGDAPPGAGGSGPTVEDIIDNLVCTQHRVRVADVLLAFEHAGGMFDNIAEFFSSARFNAK